MGAFLEKPITEKATFVGAGNDLEWSCAHMQGWRISMEDAHSAQIGLPGAPDCSFFAVFDGHGGSMVACHCAENFIAKIVSDPKWSKMEKNGAQGVENLTDVMRRSCISLDGQMRTLPQVQNGEDHSGTTAVFAMITQTHIIVGNVGDSRCVMCRGGQTIPMSYDHKPTNPPEQLRIEAAGGSVALSRVNGDLAVSRALGDYSYKNSTHLPPEAQQVSPEPEFQVQARDPADQFLILCCDGIWDVMSNEEVSNFYIKKTASGQDLQNTGCDLLDCCLEKKSRDNMTTIGIKLGKF